MNNRRRTGNNSVLVSLVSIRSPKAFSPNNDKNIKFSNISNVHLMHRKVKSELKKPILGLNIC